MVIGLQSTGDARTVEAVAERAVDGELDDFVSGPKVSHFTALMVPSEPQTKLSTPVQNCLWDQRQHVLGNPISACLSQAC